MRELLKIGIRNENVSPKFRLFIIIITNLSCELTIELNIPSIYLLIQLLIKFIDNRIFFIVF